MTFSIVAYMEKTGEFGVAVATKRPAVGARVPFARAAAGAVASQAITNPLLGSAALSLLASGAPARAALEGSLAADPHPERRQLHLVDAQGRTAAWTGSQTPDWKGHLKGEGFCVAGNHLVGPGVIEGMARAFRETRADELADRLVAALLAGEEEGGDARGRQSAALLIFRDEPVPYLDIRVDDDPHPLEALQRVLRMYRDTYLREPHPRSEFLKE